MVIYKTGVCVLSWHHCCKLQAARRIDNVYGAGVETKVDNEELKAVVEADPSQTASELAAGCDVSDKTVLFRLNKIGKVKKLQSWVPHELSAANRQTRVDCSVTLLNWSNNEGILNRIIIFDKKWIPITIADCNS
ncbi:jg23911 [Pararge aegeria aegeria]|uniref:Jg23911 protein n=1 Tax=Pararge aegeria aegeria TaxID=348720 RepID=A0A8S4S7X8_9NEOP|nr:jg23911 [Pararge aegeria aegeria]